MTTATEELSLINSKFATKESYAKVMTLRSALREEHGDADCCRVKPTWRVEWVEPGGAIIVESVAGIRAVIDDIFSDELLLETESTTINIEPHTPMTEHEIEALPEFGGW